MLYIFCGQDSFSRKEAVDELRKGMGAGDMAALNTMVFEGARLPAEQLSAACNSVPFFADRRLIIVAGLLGRFEPRERGEREESAKTAATGKGPLWQPFAECLSNLPPWIDVVLEDDNAGTRNPLFKALSKSAEARWFAPLRPGDVIAWIDRRARARGGSITPGAARLLADSVGNNLWVLSVEVEKLLVYRSLGRVTEDDVKLLVSYVRDANVFAMVDAIVERRSDVALRLMHQLMDQGATATYLVVMITRQFRLLIQAKDLVSQGVRPPDIRRLLGISSDFVFDKAMKQLGGYSLAQIEQIYRALLQLDTDSKTGKVDQEVALDLLVLDLCRRTSRPASRLVS